MSDITGRRPGFKNLGGARPRAVSLSRRELVETDYLSPGETLPLVVRPKDVELDPADWVGGSRDFIEENLLRHGGLLFRGFDVGGVERFEEFVRAFSTNLMDYLDQHTPRTRLTPAVYTSTEYPADQRVPFHSENSKNRVWPLKLWFCCLQPPPRGGETPIADNAKVFRLLDPKLSARFVEKRVMYARNFGEGVGLPWQTAFQTDDREAVERHCREQRMEFEWKDGNRLRVRHVCQAVAAHPATGETLWFNQAHLFHVAGLEPAFRESLLGLFEEEDLPSNAYYGDGSPIEDSVIAEIVEAYRLASVSFPWRPKDVLMLDNMRVAHGRAPYEGPRRVLVAMAEPYGGDAGVPNSSGVVS
ncbi:MAG TPA: TauD/TfdA family dioxygenase [Pyrinomonadaceae bacterium]